MIKKIFSVLRTRNRQFGEIYDNVKNIRFYMRRILLEDKILHCEESGVCTEKYCDHDIIISLTTYGRRLEDVCFTIESLMQQTKKANRIILWLDSSARERPLPETLIRQQKRGLEIKITEESIRSYKKLIPALRSCPNDAIITVDDDVLYDFDLIERLIGSYLAEPDCIHACRIHTMLPDEKNKLKPYADWKWYFSDPATPSRNFMTGIGGILYPPHSLDEETTNETVFTSICPTADDVWFNAMARKKGTPIRKVVTRNRRGEDYVDNDTVQDMGLFHINTGQNGLNDKQIQAVFEKYSIYELIER